jgi:hypothetical protein
VGNREAQGLGSFEVDDQLEFHGLLHGEIGGLGAFEDLSTYVAARRHRSAMLTP